MPKSNLLAEAFVLGKVRIIQFSEAFEDCDFKVSRCVEINEYIMLHEYQMSRSFFDHGHRLLHFQI